MELRQSRLSDLIVAADFTEVQLETVAREAPTHHTRDVSLRLSSLRRRLDIYEQLLAERCHVDRRAISMAQLRRQLRAHPDRRGLSPVVVYQGKERRHHERRAERSSVRPSRAAGDSKQFIIVVEDDEPTRLLLETLLSEGTGVPVVSSSDGTGVLAMAAGSRFLPALVILDLHIPGTDAVALARSLRDLSTALPIVLMSAVPVSTLRKQSERLEAFGWLAKPFEVDDLLLIARQALNGLVPGARP